MSSSSKFEVTKESRELVEGIQRAAKRFRPQINKVIKRIAESCASDVKKVIADQAFPNVRLSMAWLERKARLGLDTRTLVATKKYYDSIKAQRLADGEWGVVCSDEDLRKRLEYGDRAGKPPRPHWTPVLHDYERNFTEKFAKEIMLEVFGDD